MRDTLTACKGKFLVSYNDCEFIRELYKDFQIESVSHLNNLCALSDGPEDEEESDDKNSLNLPAELLEDAWFPPTVIWKSSVVTAHCHFGIRSAARGADRALPRAFFACYVLFDFHMRNYI